MSERERGHFPIECAPEIEWALVAGLWHEPQRLAETLRWLWPDAHLSQPFLRLVLSAITRVYTELGACDFALVVQCLRELGYLEECGGRENLDALYEARWYPPLWNIYGDFLRDVALRRAGDPQMPPRFFAGGSGTLMVNKVRRNDFSPHWIGSAWVAGKSYAIHAWPRKAQNVELKFYPQ